MSSPTGFSLVLTTYKAHEELAVTLDSLRKNSRLDNELLVLLNPLPDGTYSEGVLKTLARFDVPCIKNPTDIGPYGSWNRGAELASKDFVCFINDDQYFAPDWDVNLARRATESNVVCSQLVEPGYVRPHHTILCQNFGFFAEEFDEAGFLRFIEKTAEDRLAWDGYYIPMVIHKRLFNELGRWPEIRPFPYPNDKFFRYALWKRGLEIQRVLNSFSYHFQNSSQKNKEEKRTAYRLYHDWRAPGTEPRTRTLRENVRSGVKSLLRRAGYRPRVSGFAFPTKADRKLAYEHLQGRGLEIGCAAERFPHINALHLDICRSRHNVRGVHADLVGDGVDLSALGGRTFDFVLSHHALERTADPARALAAWKTALKPDGRLMLIVRETPTVRLESVEDALRKAGFDVAAAIAASEKNRGIDEMNFRYDDFTIVATPVKREAALQK